MGSDHLRMGRTLLCSVGFLLQLLLLALNIFRCRERYQHSVGCKRRMWDSFCNYCCWH